MEHYLDRSIRDTTYRDSRYYSDHGLAIRLQQQYGLSWRDACWYACMDRGSYSPPLVRPVYQPKPEPIIFTPELKVVLPKTVTEPIPKFPIRPVPNLTPDVISKIMEEARLRRLTLNQPTNVDKWHLAEPEKMPEIITPQMKVKKSKGRRFIEKCIDKVIAKLFSKV